MATARASGTRVPKNMQPRHIAWSIRPSSSGESSESGGSTVARSRNRLPEGNHPGRVQFDGRDGLQLGALLIDGHDVEKGSVVQRPDGELRQERPGDGLVVRCTTGGSAGELVAGG